MDGCEMSTDLDRLREMAQPTVRAMLTLFKRGGIRDADAWAHEFTEALASYGQMLLAQGDRCEARTDVFGRCELVSGHAGQHQNALKEEFRADGCNLPDFDTARLTLTPSDNFRRAARRILNERSEEATKADAVDPAVRDSTS